jgi:hypothetical protein
MSPTNGPTGKWEPQMTSKEAIERVMAQEPHLTRSGFFQGLRDLPTFGTPRSGKCATRCSTLITWTCEWLNRQTRTKNLNRRAGTRYALKHEAEKEVGCVQNGMFIAAAIACGFKVSRRGDGPNAHMNISARCWGDDVLGVNMHQLHGMAPRCRTPRS